MSRHTTRFDNKELAWGYDNPINEYFIQLWDSKREPFTDDPIFSIGTVAPLTPHPKYPDKTKWSKDEVLAIYKEYSDHIPESHIRAMENDKPF